MPYDLIQSIADLSHLKIVLPAVVIYAALMFLGWFILKKWSWACGAWVGALLGLLFGSLVYVKVPLPAQYAFIGAFLGMGADGLVGLAKHTTPATVIGALAAWVENAVKSVRGAGAPAGVEVPLSWGLWTAFAFFFLVIVIGLFDPTAT